MKDYKTDVGLLAIRLNYTEEEFRKIVQNSQSYYRPFHLVTSKKDQHGKIVKKTRHIDNPHKALPLRDLQKQINKILLSPNHGLIHEALKGGLKKRSILDHISPHIGHKTVICMDLTNCFPNISKKKSFQYLEIPTRLLR